MVKLGAIAFGLLAFVAQVSAQQTVKVMPFGASIVSVNNPHVQLLTIPY